MNKFTEPVRRALDGAHRFAGDFVGTEHLLLALTQVPGLASSTLADEGMSVERLASVVAIGRGGPTGSIPFSPGAKRVLELALSEALDRGDDDIETGHLLLALLGGDTETGAAVALTSAGGDARAVCRSIDEKLAAGEHDGA